MTKLLGLGRILLLVAVVAASVFVRDVRCSAAGESTFSAEKIMVHARHLAGEPFQGRRAGTPFERRAAVYVTAQLDRSGIPPFASKTRTQRVRLSDRADDPESLNVLGWIAPKTRNAAEGVLVLGAHIDHLGQVEGGGYFPGAEDNASGVAVVLEVAAALQRGRAELRRPICVVFFGAEEVGLVGSTQFVQNGPIDRKAIVAMVNVDMIGRPLVEQSQLAWAKKLLKIDSMNSVGVVGTQGRPFFRDVVTRACEQAKMTPFGHQAVLSPIVQSLARNRADHSPFESVGIPTLFFGSGESDDYHKVTDTIDKLEPELMARRAGVVYQVVLELAKAPRQKLPEREELEKKTVPDAVPMVK